MWGFLVVFIVLILLFLDRKKNEGSFFGGKFLKQGRNLFGGVLTVVAVLIVAQILDENAGYGFIIYFILLALIPVLLLLIRSIKSLMLDEKNVTSRKDITENPWFGISLFVLFLIFVWLFF